MMFKNRVEAGERLARKLQQYRGQDAVVYGLPRGGVIVAEEVARSLEAPLDVLVVRKIGHPYNPELAIGALAEDGEIILDEAWEGDYDVQWLQERISAERAEARRRGEMYLRDRVRPAAVGRSIIVVDDGIATGLTIKVAVLEARRLYPRRIVVAVPVAPLSAIEELRIMADEVVAVDIPDAFAGSIGEYYDDFRQVTDREVVEALDRAQTRRADVARRAPLQAVA